GQPVAQRFDCTGDVQRFTPPPGASSFMTITAVGAAGGAYSDGFTTTGGRGASVKADVGVIGIGLSVLAGCLGGDVTGGGPGGGGGSFGWFGFQPLSLSTDLLLAAGGGGGAYQFVARNADALSAGDGAGTGGGRVGTCGSGG